MRSPSQRWRDSSFERTAPRLVAFSITRTARSTRPAASASATSNEIRNEKPGIADDLHRRMLAQPVDEGACGRLLAFEPDRQRAQAALQQPGCVGRGDDPGAPTHQMEPLEERVVGGGHDTGKHVVVAGEDLRRRVQDGVAALLERADAERRSHRRVADDGSAVRHRGLEVRHRQDRVRRRLDQHEVGPGRWWSGLIELDEAQTPRCEVEHELRVTVVGGLSDGDRRAGVRHREQDSGDGAHPGREEQRPPAVERAERFFARHARRSQYVFNLNVALRGKPHSERFNEDKQNVALAYDTYHKLEHQLKQMDRAGILDIYSPLLKILEDKIKETEDRFTKFWRGTRMAS